jgi:hypothetical protein
MAAAATDTFISLLLFSCTRNERTNRQKKNSYCVYVYVGDVLTIKYEKGNKR